ncbi:MAG: HAMP domain-containing histidine kinase [Bacteriovorax sp.]|nr:HAMP domain-containing histidine kinase [Bacteriovorax sp.]
MNNKTSLRLKKSIPEILNRWEKVTVESHKGSHGQKSLELRDSLPEFLNQLVEVLENCLDKSRAKKIKDAADSKKMGSKHGKDRAINTSYTMNEMIFEYHILRKVICEVIDEDVPLTFAEREVIISSVEQAVSGAATGFSSSLKEMQEQFSLMIAHDLRNPISAAKTSAQLILRRPDDIENCINKAGLISTSMDRVDLMISDLLNISLLRAGETLVLEFKKCDLDWLTRETLNEMNITYGKIFNIHSSGKCTGHWNENGLRRIIENLTSNAVKYGSERAPIDINISHDEESAFFSIHNEGEAIALKDQEAIFRNFYRAKSAENKVGWGLGLPMVKGMVEAHKGSITVESKKNRGTTFSIVIPRDAR